MSLKTTTEKVLEPRKNSVKKNALILFDDNVHTFDYVINLLIKVCNHDEIQAEQCANLVHYKGKCTIKNGALEELTIMGEILADSGLTVEIE